MEELHIRRQNRDADLAAVAALNRAAFGKHGGGKVFQRMRESADDIVSLVAERDGQVVGQVLFCPVDIEADPPLAGMGLGELAVHPDWQRRGIGRALTEAGCEILRAGNCPYVIVVGVPEYYPRVGFEPGAAHGLRCQWQVPAESFMVRILDPLAMAGVSGLARYRGI